MEAPRRSTIVGRRGWLIGVPLLLLLCLAACGGGGGPAPIPSTGAGVCDGLKQAERFRYVVNYTIDSPKPNGPIDESAVGSPPFSIPPAADDFSINITNDGSAVLPDSLDYELSVPNTPAARTIRVGDRQWIRLGAAWQEQMNPGPLPFHPTNVCDTILSTLGVPAATGAVEQVNDTAARHFRLAAVPLDVSSKLFGPQSDMARLLKSYDVDFWIGEDDGRLVKVEAASTATYPSKRELTLKLTLEISSYNDDGIVIQPPV